jgi:hypothetical protein
MYGDAIGSVEAIQPIELVMHARIAGTAFALWMSVQTNRLHSLNFRLNRLTGNHE